MKLKDIIEKLNLECINAARLDDDINSAYASDLLSDVMGNASEGQIWITVQTHKNVMAIASLKDMPAVILVKGSVPDPDMLEQAQNEDICLLVTKDETFEICGKLYELIK